MIAMVAFPTPALRSAAVTTGLLVSLLVPLGLRLGMAGDVVLGTALVAAAMVALSGAPPSGTRRLVGNMMAAAGGLAGAWGLLEAATQSSPTTSGLPAATVVFLAGALLLEGGRSLASSLLLGAAVWLALLRLVILGYRLGGAEPLNGLAVHGGFAAALHLLLGTSVLLLRPSNELLSLVTSATRAGRLSRRLLLVVLLVPTLSVWLRVVAQRAGLIGTEVGSALVMMLNTAVVAAILFGIAHSLHRAETGREEVARERELVERRFRTLFRENPLPTWVYDPETLRFLDVNDAAVREYGYSREEFLAMGVGRIEWPASPPGAARSAAGARHELPMRHLRQDGTAIEVEVHAETIELEGRPARLVVARDVSERRRAQEALERSEALYRLIADNATDLITKHSLDGRTTYASPACRRLLGYEPKQLVGRSAYDDIHPDDVPGVWRAHLELLDSTGDRVHRHRVRRRDGTYIWLETASRLVRDPRTAEGREILSVSRDITERRQAEEELRQGEERLRQAQKMEAIGRFAGGIAHDFNTMLGVIMGYAHLLQKALPAGQPSRRQVDEILRATERAAGITRQLLAFGRKKTEHGLEVVDPAQAVGQMQELLARLLGDRIELQVRSAPEIGRIRVDPGHLEQVLMNLATNARDAMPGGGRFTIELSNAVLGDGEARRAGLQAGPFVALEVSDTGEGMDEATLSRVFEPFFTTKGAGRGTGLGLATVYSIVAQCGGAVQVESARGAGTRFRVLLPQVEEAAG